MKYDIKGGDLQILEVTLSPGESFKAESGAMVAMGGGIRFTAQLDGKGIFGKAGAFIKRKIAHESGFVGVFENVSDDDECVYFANSFPGTILPVQVSSDMPIYCQKGAYLCSTPNVNLSIALTKKITAGFFGGEGFILQKLTVADVSGVAFLQAGGFLLKKKLDGVMRIDTGCLVGFSGDIKYSVGFSGGVKTMLFGGEGAFLAILEGKGEVYLQSLPIQNFIYEISKRIPKPSNK